MAQDKAIDAFLNSYEVGPDHRPLSLSERELLHDALSDFLVHEQWIRGDTPNVEPAVAVKQLAADPALHLTAEAQATFTAASAAILNLTAQLARREQANAVMREHLCVLSDELKHTRDKRD